MTLRGHADAGGVRSPGTTDAATTIAYGRTRREDELRRGVPPVGT